MSYMRDASGRRLDSIGVSAVGDFYKKDPAPMPFAIAPVAVAGGFVFQPQVGALSYTADGQAHSTAPTSDFSLMIGATWFENIVYSSVTPYGDTGWTATATVGTSPTVTVQVTVNRLATGVWRKRIVLTASATTTVQLYQGYNCPAGPVWRHLCYDTNSLSNPGTNTAFPMIGVVSPVNVSQASTGNYVQAFCMMPDTGPNGWWGINPSSNGFIYGGSARLGLYAGLGFSGASAMTLTANVPTTVGFTHFTAPIYGAYYNGSQWTTPSIDTVRRRCHQVAAIVHGSTAGDPFTQMLIGTARARVAKASAADASGAWLQPAPNYSNCYVRDSFLTQLGLMDANTSRQLLTRWVNNVEAVTNRVPTFATVSATTGAITYPQYIFDDSNALTLMWALWHYSTFGEKIGTPTQLGNIAAGIQSMLGSDFYWQSERGAGGAGMFDSLTHGLPATYTTAMLTGYAYIGLRCAAILGVGVPAATITGLKTAYQSFHVGGYMRTFFDRSTYTDPYGFVDVISLHPDFWSQFFLNEQLLTDAQVASHLDKVFATNVVAMPKGRALACIKNPDGSYLASSYFNATYPGQPTTAPPGGVYQNGGAWLLWEFLCLATGKLHNYTNQDLDAMWRDRILAETCVDFTLHEEINTTNAGAYVQGSCYPSSFGYGWNAAIATLQHFAGLRMPLS